VNATINLGEFTKKGTITFLKYLQLMFTLKIAYIFTARHGAGAYDSSYSGGRDQENCGFLGWAKS
jgi:hypothetical protein